MAAYRSHSSNTPTCPRVVTLWACSVAVQLGISIFNIGRLIAGRVLASYPMWPLLWVATTVCAPVAKAVALPATYAHAAVIGSQRSIPSPLPGRLYRAKTALRASRCGAVNSSHVLSAPDTSQLAFAVSAAAVAACARRLSLFLGTDRSCLPLSLISHLPALVFPVALWWRARPTAQPSQAISLHPADRLRLSLRLQAELLNRTCTATASAPYPKHKPLSTSESLLIYCLCYLGFDRLLEAFAGGCSNGENSTTLATLAASLFGFSGSGPSTDQQSRTGQGRHGKAAKRTEKGSVASLSQLPSAGYRTERLPACTLKNRGNSCFIDATLAYLAHTLSPAELAAVRDNSFARNNPEAVRTLCEGKEAQAELLRHSFVDLLEALAAAETDTERLNGLRWHFFAALHTFVYTPPLHRASLQLFGKAAAGQFMQQDPDELIKFMNEITGMHLNLAATLSSCRVIHYDIEGQRHSRLVSDQHDRIESIALGMPAPQQGDYRKVTSINALLRYNGAAQYHTGANRLRLTAEDARLLPGLRDSPIRETGGFFTGASVYRFCHPDPARFEHITVALKLVTGSHKITTLGRRLLANEPKGRIELNIAAPQNILADDQGCAVPMRLDAVVMHRGKSASAGHYVCAFERHGAWHIHDDLQDKLVILKPEAGNESLHPLPLLIAFMERLEMDPVLLHYRRQRYEQEQPAA